MLIYIALLGLSMTAAALGGDLSLIFYKYITTSWDTECHLVPSYYTLSSLLSQYLLGLCTLLIGVARGFARVIALLSFVLVSWRGFVSLCFCYSIFCKKKAFYYVARLVGHTLSSQVWPI